MLLQTACSSSEESSAADAGGDVSLSLSVDLPSSVSTESAYTDTINGSLGKTAAAVEKIQTRTAAEDIAESMDAIRVLAGLAAHLGRTVSDLLLEVEQSLAGFDFKQQYTGVEGGLVISFGPGSSYPKHLSVWTQADGNKLLEADWQGSFTADNFDSEGVVRLGGAAFGSASLFVQMDFDTVDENGGKHMLVQAGGVEPGGLENLWLDARAYTNSSGQNQLTVSGNTYFSAFSDEPLLTEERNYIFVASVLADENRAAIDIAFPRPADVTAGNLATVFDDHSYSAVYSQLLTDYVNQTDSLCTAVKFLLTSLKTCSPGSFTVSEVQTAFNSPQVDSYPEVLQARFAFSLQNSFYSASGGYVANGESPGGVYTVLDQANAAARADSSLVILPSEVKALSLAFDTPDMPAGPYDF